MPLDDDTPPPFVRLFLISSPRPRLHGQGNPEGARNGQAAGNILPFRSREDGRLPPTASLPRPAAEDAGYIAALEGLDRLHAELRELQAAFAAAFARLDITAPDGEHQAAARSRIEILARRMNGGFAAQDSILTHFLDP